MIGCSSGFRTALGRALATWTVAILSLALFAASLFAAPAPDSAVPGTLLAADQLAQQQPQPPTQPPTQPPAQPPATGPAVKDPNIHQAQIWTPRTETGTFHIHGGVFDPVNNANAVSTTLGARLGVNMGSHMLLGIMGDWSFKTKSVLDTSETTLPGFKPKLLLAKVDAHLIPAMLFLQVKLTEKFFIVPYGGVAGGYEWLLLRAKDYRTDQTASATYANWAWEAYAGMGLRLSPKLRVDGEVFYNGASLGRDVLDQNGQPWRELVDAQGVGGRVGLDIVY